MDAVLHAYIPWPECPLLWLLVAERFLLLFPIFQQNEVWCCFNNEQTHGLRHYPCRLSPTGGLCGGQVRASARLLWFNLVYFRPRKAYHFCIGLLCYKPHSRAAVLLQDTGIWLNKKRMEPNRPLGLLFHFWTSLLRLAMLRPQGRRRRGRAGGTLERNYRDSMTARKLGYKIQS